MDTSNVNQETNIPIAVSEEDIRIRFKKHIDGKGIMYKFLAELPEINVSPGHMTNVLNCKRTLTNDLKAKLNTYLGTEF